MQLPINAGLAHIAMFGALDEHQNAAIRQNNRAETKHPQNINSNYHLFVQRGTKKSQLASIELLNRVLITDGKRWG